MKIGDIILIPDSFCGIREHYVVGFDSNGNVITSTNKADIPVEKPKKEEKIEIEPEEEVVEVKVKKPRTKKVNNAE